MKTVLTAQQQRLVDIEVERFRTIGSAHANSFVLKAIYQDPIAIAITRACVYEVVRTMHMPPSPLMRDIEEYRAQTAEGTIRRLEANELRGWRAYVNRQTTRPGHFDKYVYITARWVATDLTRREYERKQHLDDHHARSHATRIPFLEVMPTDEMLQWIRVTRHLSALKQRDLHALYFRALGYSWQEVAKLYPQKTTAAVTAKIRRIREALRVAVLGEE